MQINFEKPALSDSAALREILIFCQILHLDAATGIILF